MEITDGYYGGSGNVFSVMCGVDGMVIVIVLVVGGGMVVAVVPANQIIYCKVHCRMANEMVLINTWEENRKERTNSICILLSTTPTNIHEISSCLHT